MVTRRQRRGYTLIELLVAVTIIGILATVAITRYSDTKQRAVVAAMRSDVRNLTSMQESFLAGNSRYATTLTEAAFVPSEGVEIEIVESTVGGWSAKATNPAAGTVICAVFVGGAAPVAPATSEGVISCQ